MARIKLVENMKFLLLLITTLLLVAEATRTKRQAQDERLKNNANKQRPAMASAVASDPSDGGVSSMGSSASAMASSSSGSMPLAGAAKPDDMGRRPGRPKMRPQQSYAEPNMDDDQADQVDEDQEVAAAPQPPRRKRPSMRRKPPARHSRYEDEEECDDYGNEYDYGNMFSAAFRPMRQMGDMMGSMFEQMQGLASGDFQDLPGGNYAVASARSNGDGYSKQSSIVSNNGRTRGIISETRNGKTQTRRIGDDDDQ